MRRVKVKTPSAKVVTHFRKRKNAKLTCHKCGIVLAGTKPATSKVAKMSKSEKRPERPYGGVLCSKCMRALFIKKARGEE
jgi:large subunit ribosomal protein L34e